MNTDSFENIFDTPGERFLVTTGGNPRSFFEEHAALELATEFADLVARMKEPVADNSQTIGFLDLRQDCCYNNVVAALGDDFKRTLAPWMLADVIRQELDTPDGALIGGGRINLFWVPEPVAVYEETTDGKWHCRRAFRNESLERFDRIFFEI